MKIIIAGGTGFIGKKLVDRLIDDENSVVVLSRKSAPSRSENGGKFKYAQWDTANVGEWANHLKDAHAVINLSGEPIAGKRWTRNQKEKIVRSRIIPTGTLVSAIGRSSPKPGLLLNASAVGYYGNVPDGEIDESSPNGTGFLSDTCVRWESESMKAAEMGVRVVNLRIGLVLSSDGGALPRLTAPFRFWAGGSLGNGKQWMPWIHVDDLISAIKFILTNYELYGPVNGVSPAPVIMKDFSKVVGKVMKRPSWMPVPSFVLRILLGEMAEMLTTGQKAIPKKLKDFGFQFKYNTLNDALTDLLIK